MNGRPVDSCLVLAVEADGEHRTIEGIAPTGSALDPIQSAFLEGGRAAVRHLHAGIHRLGQSAAR
jgi:aerobic-type carbon monoxide dehydrogenase small subunit (CoxS/CutS family)